MTYSKREIDEFVLRIINDGDSVKFTTGELRSSNRDMYNAINKEYGSLSNAIMSSGEYVLNKAVPRNWNRDSLLYQIKLGYDLGETLHVSYLNAFNGSSVVFRAIKEFGSWNDAIIKAGVPIEYIETESSRCAKLGHRFEYIVSMLFSELGIAYKDNNAHDRYKPDFVNGTHWYDAKLSEFTHRSKDHNKPKTTEKYEPLCDKLTLVYLRGKKYGVRNVSDKTTLISVYHYVDLLPVDRRKFYEDMLAYILEELGALLPDCRIS